MRVTKIREKTVGRYDDTQQRRQDNIKVLRPFPRDYSFIELDYFETRTSSPFNSIP